jgi:hypothetical protein
MAQRVARQERRIEKGMDSRVRRDRAFCSLSILLFSRNLGRDFVARSATKSRLVLQLLLPLCDEQDCSSARSFLLACHFQKRSIDRTRDNRLPRQLFHGTVHDVSVPLVAREPRIAKHTRARFRTIVFVELLHR